MQKISIMDLNKSNSIMPVDIENNQTYAKNQNEKTDESFENAKFLCHEWISNASGIYILNAFNFKMFKF